MSVQSTAECIVDRAIDFADGVLRDDACVVIARRERA
jgi:hypothetical protein